MNIHNKFHYYSGVSQAGFTLLEVLVAFAIVTIGFTALAKTISSSIHQTEAVTARTLAYWVASNHASELHISGQLPSSGSDHVIMGKESWKLQRIVSTTADTDIFKIVINVYRGEDIDNVLARLTTYIARFDAPKKLQ